MPLEYTDKKLMQCRICERKFSDADCITLDFFPDTSICFDCYEEGRKKSYSAWCFGKPLKITSTGQRQGYDPFNAANRSCSEWCPDKRYCPLFAEGLIYRLRVIARVT